MTSAENAIIVENLHKHFRIRYRTHLKTRMLNLLKRQPPLQEFTALHNVSFTVPRGQTVAVIGRNGSGKSTLLCLLARVYRKTGGVIQMSAEDGSPARIAPLLDLSAGFHLDLTGAENILFYGAVLGNTAKEMRACFDSIVEFAELGSKVDTHLRNWNEGARLRLGFSIAVHTNPDILLVDEVLAVGDEAFQAKCYAYIRKMQSLGKTIVFVTHDLRTVERVAQRVIWLNQGNIQMDGDVGEVLQSYRVFSAGAAFTDGLN